MFKKRNRVFRGRRKDSGSDNDQTTDTKETGAVPGNGISTMEEGSNLTALDDLSAISTVSVVKVKKSKKKKEKEKPMPKSSSVLSFEHDEDEAAEVFKIKKSSHSKRVAKQLKKEMLKEKEEDKARATPPPVEYNAQTLQELRDEQAIQNGVSVVRVSSPGVGSDVEFSDDEKEDEKGPTFKEMISSGQIPDATMIHAIRKRRQLAREHGDFIPLDDTVKADTNKSRLIREDENDASDEDGERINFSVGASRETELRQIQQTIIQANDESNEEEGSDHEWETQQIRKGVGIPVQHLNEGSQDSGGYQQYMYGGNLSGTDSPASGFHMGGLQPFQAGGLDASKRTIQVSDLPAISLTLIKKRLADRLEEMRSVHRAHANERTDLSSRVDDSQTTISECSYKKQGLENQYRFFQEMRGYVTDLVECLNEKVPMINHLEKSIYKLWQKRAEKIVERRQQDVKDESKDCLMGLDKSKPVDPSVLDQERMRRVAEREARRNRRRKRREQRGTQARHEDGMSTDDEKNPSELAHYNSEKDRLTTEAVRLFEDVESDFCELGTIKVHFERWRNEQGESYHEAYIALCLPKLFTPFVKLKLLDWNPLHHGCAELTIQEWYESLMFYGHKEGRAIDRNDDDLKLMPNIIEKVIVPKLTVLVQTVWDPMSSSQTENLVASLTHFISVYPTLTADSKHTKALMKAVVERIRKTLDDDVFMPLYPKPVLEAKGAAWAFFQRQSWQCYKLLSNILLWRGLIEQPALSEMALDALLNRYVLLGLQNSPLNDETILRCNLIAGKLPKQWFSGLSEGDCTLPQLESFCRFLMQCARVLHDLAMRKPSEQKQVRDKIKQIAKILVNIHAMDHSMELANQYSVKVQQL